MRHTQQIRKVMAEGVKIGLHGFRGKRTMRKLDRIAKRMVDRSKGVSKATRAEEFNVGTLGAYTKFRAERLILKGY